MPTPSGGEVAVAASHRVYRRVRMAVRGVQPHAPDREESVERSASRGVFLNSKSPSAVRHAHGGSSRKVQGLHHLQKEEDPSKPRPGQTHPS